MSESSNVNNNFLVAPFTGAWIEICKGKVFIPLFLRVAPFTGAWIGIQDFLTFLQGQIVAPFTGAWIEIN